MVKRNSLLGRALEAQLTLGEQLPGYGALLSKIAGSDQAGPEFDRVVARAKPASADELAGRLLHLVVMTALESSMAAPRGDHEAGEGARESVVVERRAAVEASYEKLLDALDVLAGAFGAPDVCILPPPEDASRPRPVTAGKPGFVSDDCPELRIAVDAWRVAFGHAESTSDDPRALAWRDHVRFETKVAPAALLAMREHLTTRRAASLASLGEFPSGRNQGSGADRRAFAIMLSGRMADMVRSPQTGFVATMTTILFGGPNNVYTLEGTKRLVSLEARRVAHGRR